MEQKRVRDLMLSLDEYATIEGGKTIGEALEVLRRAQQELIPGRHFHRAILVLDEKGMVIGKLSQWAILRSLEPTFLKYEDEEALVRSGLSNDFIESMKSTLALFRSNLEQICKAAGTLRARDAMVPIGESISEDALLIDAIHLIVMKHVLSLPVTRQGRVVGILRQSDIFEEVSSIIRSYTT
jgi:CBS domain-containing protein